MPLFSRNCLSTHYAFLRPNCGLFLFGLTNTQDIGQRIAHGTLIFSVTMGMTAEDMNPVAFSYDYG
jgi:hypothetical protein